MQISFRPLELPYAAIAIGDDVNWIVPAYRDFVTQHASVFSESQLQTAQALIDRFLVIPISVIPCRVIGMELLTAVGSDTFSVLLQSAGGETFSVVSIKATSDRLITSPHLITRSAYMESMQRLKTLHQRFNGIVTEDPSTVLSKDVAVTQLFSLSQDASETVHMGELYEGLVYDVAEDALEKPYQVVLCIFSHAVDSRDVAWGECDYKEVGDRFLPTRQFVFVYG